MSGFSIYSCLLINQATAAARIWVTVRPCLGLSQIILSCPIARSRKFRNSCGLSREQTLVLHKWYLKVYLYSMRSLNPSQRGGRSVPGCAHTERELGGGPPPPVPLVLVVLGVVLGLGAATLQHVQRLPHHATRAHLRAHGHCLTLEIIAAY